MGESGCRCSCTRPRFAFLFCDCGVSIPSDNTSIGMLSSRLVAHHAFVRCVLAQLSYVSVVHLRQTRR